MTTDNTKRREPLFLARMPADLRSQLEHEAKASERSLTAEILFRLRSSLKSNEAAA